MTQELIDKYQSTLIRSQKRRVQIFLISMVGILIIFFFAYFVYYGYSQRFYIDVAIRLALILHSIYLYRILNDQSFQKYEERISIYLIHLSATGLYLNYDVLPYPTLSVLIDIAIAYFVIFFFPVNNKFKLIVVSIHLMVDLVINDLLKDMDGFIRILTIVIAYLILMFTYYVSEELRANDLKTLELLQDQLQLKESIKKLEGLLPICMYCRKIRNMDEEWETLDNYLLTLPEVEITHSVCEDCLKEHLE
ncbi:MAG: hypothetical protein INQ03_12465 [Candidatus Heimdallarchaeota archaeon]|nr:hypothetical protein [Candidatus Heimdallarchaeota archaeon]